MFSEFRSHAWRVSRVVFKQVHLWLGVASALVLTVVCFSGALYVFNEEIKRLLNRDVYFVNDDNYIKPYSIEDLIPLVEEITGGNVASVVVPDVGNMAWSFMVRREGERRASTWLVNQYTGQVTSSADLKGDGFFRTVIRLHRWLLLDRAIGRPIVGWATIIMSILIISGLVIWLPRNVRFWYKGLKLKFSGSGKRLNYDLHRGLGFYAAILILAMTITGPFWSFEWYRAAFLQVLGIEAQVPTPRVQPVPLPTQALGVVATDSIVAVVNDFPEVEKNSQFLEPKNVFSSFEKILEIASDELPYRGVSRIQIPDADAISISIRRSRTGFFAYSGVDRVEINRVTAQVENINRFTDLPVNEQIAGSIRALHTGEIFGTFTKILYFIAALIASMLPVTGVIIWINRLRGKRGK